MVLSWLVKLLCCLFGLTSLGDICFHQIVISGYELSYWSMTSSTTTDNSSDDQPDASISSPTKTEYTRNELPFGNQTSPIETETPKNVRSIKNITSTNKAENLTNVQFDAKVTAPTGTITDELSYENITLPTETDNPRDVVTDESVLLPTATENPRKDLFDGTVSTPTGIGTPRNKKSNGITATLIDALNPGNGTSHSTSIPLDRRQYAGQKLELSDLDITRLLNKARDFMKKYPKGKPLGANNDQSHANNTQPFSMGQRGPLGQKPFWNNPAVPRQGRRTTANRQPPSLVTQTVNPNAPPERDATPGDDDDDEKTTKSSTETTQNEAQGAASRFTTRRTTKGRRRRTSPSRVSLEEDCDYLAYYCLKAYDTGTVCAKTVYRIRMTFENYCMVDYINCMERYDIWIITHMGECFEMKILTEYRGPPNPTTEVLGPDDERPTERDVHDETAATPAAAQHTTQNEAQGAASRFTTRITTTRRRRRTTPTRVSFKEDCDYIAYYCLKAYRTGKVCARTLYFTYMTFKNYCMVDYVNCMERYDIWQILHMGECMKIKVLTEYLHYPYLDDYFLDNYYIVEDM